MTTAIITRPQIVIEQTAEVYQKAGIQVFKAPCFAIKTNLSVQPQWLYADADVWIVLSVHALNHALLIAPDLQPTATTRVIAVGPAVVKAWRLHFDHPVSSHPLMNSEGVIELLTEFAAKSVKILTTLDGRNLIKSHCMNAQISYSQINTYHRKELPIDTDGLSQIIQNNTETAVVLTATSSGILSQFMTQLSDELKEVVLSNPLVVGAQRIAELASELGFADIHVAASPSDEAMCEVVQNTKSPG